MRIIICGCGGKMGKTVINTTKNYSDCEIVAGIDKQHQDNFEFPVFSNPSEITADADVIIDFSHPSMLSNLLDYSIKTHTPAVICTTGLSESQLEEIKEVSKTVPIFYSRNMSLGVNLLAELSRKAAEFLKSDFDVEIIEKHHNQKIDAPSGTALMLAEEISNAANEKPVYVFDRTQTRKSRSKDEIGIHCVRGGNICGDHEVIFAGNNEIITLSHHAGSREIFANGAIKAAFFLQHQKPGLYEMKDIIENI